MPYKVIPPNQASYVCTCLAPESIFCQGQSFWVTWSRAKSVLQAVRLGYVTKINLTMKAWEEAIQELGKMSTKIAWHSPRTPKYANNQLQRGEYFKVTSCKTVEFSFNHTVLCYLLRNRSLYT